MAAPSSSGFAADPIYQAAVAASAGMSGATGALPTQQEALTAPPPPPPQGASVMEMIQQPQGAPVMEMVPPVMALQLLQTEDMMGPPMMATQLLQAVEMIARLPLPTAAPDFLDMPSGEQMTGCEQIPSVDSHERSLPLNASKTLYVEGLPSNYTRWELIHIFRSFSGFCGVHLITRGFDNRHGVAFVEFNTPAQAFSAMKSLQGYLFDIPGLYSHSLHLQFFPPSPGLDDGLSW